MVKENFSGSGVSVTVSQSAAIVAWIIIALLSVGFAALVRQISILTRIVRAGIHSPSITGSNPIVGMRLPDHLKSLGWSNSNLVLFFIAPNCTSCAQLLDEITQHSDIFAIVDCKFLIISRGRCPDHKSLLPDWSCIEESSAEHRLFKVFNVPGTPYIATVNTEGLVVDADLVVDIDSCFSLVYAIDPTKSESLRAM